ncbi:hypothetical protein ACTACG_07575 [Pseudomonas syringae]|uniref:hypothetical protein n=1 Tax=Pseudomonas syringae TaxID=317 RepID=UPI003F74C5CF
MVLKQKQLDEKTALKRQKAGKEELRLRVRPGTKQSLMELASIEEQGEVMTLLIRHRHALGKVEASSFLQVPRHEITVSRIVAVEFHRKSMLMTQQDPGDEIMLPNIATDASHSL